MIDCPALEARAQGLFVSFLPPVMEATTIKEGRPAAEEAARAPIKTFRLDEVSASVFAVDRKIRGEAVTFHTVSFSRSYLGSDGKRRYAKTFDADDLERIVLLAQQASDYLLGLRHRA